MKKLTVSIITILALFISFAANCLACTSFAVYSDKTYYGMNFDHSISDIRFSIHNGTQKGVIVFSMDFFINGGYYPTVSMNNQGFFSSCQMVYPEKPVIKKTNDNQLDMVDLFSQMPDKTSKVQDVRDAAAGRQMICQYNFVHTLFADSSRDAMVLETDNTETFKTDINGKSIIMTNFYNSALGDSGKAVGTGSDRYITARDYIDSHLSSFSFNDCMTVLQNTVQKSGSFPTQCSMVFDPAKAEVYIAIGRDFTKVWKVSINNRAIETFEGFDRHVAATIGKMGISPKDLASLSNNRTVALIAGNLAIGSFTLPGWVLCVVAGLVVMGSVVYIKSKTRKKKIPKAL